MPELASSTAILAFLLPSELLAPKPRPKTNASVAKRLLGHDALGLPGAWAEGQGGGGGPGAAAASSQGGEAREGGR